MDRLRHVDGHPADPEHGTIASRGCRPIGGSALCRSRALRPTKGSRPRCGFTILDRPMPETAAGLTLETAPRGLGQVWLFGKQTTAEGRLELIVWRDERLPKMPPDLERSGWRRGGNKRPRGGPVERRAIGARINDRLLLPRDATFEQRSEMEHAALRRARLEETSRTPLKLLGGRTPEQAAADPPAAFPLLAFVLVMESTANLSRTVFDFNDLRRRWGLPVGERSLSRGTRSASCRSRVWPGWSAPGWIDEALLRAYFRAGRGACSRGFARHGAGGGRPSEPRPAD